MIQPHHASHHDSHFLDNPTVSIVIPAHNEGDRIRWAVASVFRVFECTERSVEVVVVDDGSTDATLLEAMALADRYPGRVRVVPLKGNHGKGFAIRTGFAYTRGAIVGFIDADLEYPVDALPLMADIVDMNPATCAIASRVVDDRRPWERLTSQAAHKVASFALRLPIHDTQAGLKMFPGSFARTALTACREDGWLYDIEALLHAADQRLNIIEIPVMQKSVRRRRANVWGMMACGPSLLRLTWSRWQALRRDHEFRQMLRFGLVGLTNSLIDMAAYWALIRMWSPNRNGVQAGFESLLAWLFASIVGYALHSRFTFRQRLSASGFYLVTGLGVAIQVVITGTITQGLGAGDALWGKILGIGVASLVTYLGYRVVARKSRQSDDTPRSLVQRADIPTVFAQDVSTPV